MFRLSRCNRFRTSRFFRSGGGDNPKPTWTIPHEQKWEPTTPDRQYFQSHAFYDPTTLWLRGVRPQLEKIIEDSWKTITENFWCWITPVQRVAQRSLPDVRYAFVAALSTTGVILYLAGQSADKYAQYIELGRLTQLEKAAALEKEGFWKSESVEVDQKTDALYQDALRLNQLWESALTNAVESRSFEALVEKLAVDEHALPDSIPSATTMRFDLMPYGAENPQTQTFATPGNEQPIAPLNWPWPPSNIGDYINRKDAKTGSMRHSRQVYGNVYVAPTK